jgi:benzoate membrane transport protein
MDAAPAATSPPHGGGVAAPALAGIVAAVVGFAGSFAIVLAGLHAVGASDAQASSGLLVLSIGMGVTGAGLSYRYKMPLSIAWSTPGAALLVTAGHVSGGYPAALGAFLLAGALVVLAGLSERVTKAIISIPGPLASGLLAGVLLEVCVQPARALVDVPGHAAPVVATWLVLWVFARRWAVIGALAVLALTVIIDPASGHHHAHALPQLTLTAPTFHLGTLIGLGVPLFLVTMVSQNVAGLSVLAANGYVAPVRPALVATGAGSMIGAPFGGHAINLAAITMAMCAGPDADPDPQRRWIAGLANGLIYFVLGPLAGLATVLLAASPVVLIECIAGLAMLPTLAASLRAATDDDSYRDPAIATFVVSASGITAFGITAPFWGLVAGLLLLGARSLKA